MQLLSDSEARREPVALSTVAMAQEDGEELGGEVHVDPQSLEDTTHHLLCPDTYTHCQSKQNYSTVSPNKVVPAFLNSH